jgi:hypothetical protein
MNTTLAINSLVVFWTRACSFGVGSEACELPRQLGEPLPIRLEIRAPEAGGQPTSTQTEVQAGRWRAQIILIRKPATAQEPETLVTQIEIRERVEGVVAICTRYDAVAELKGFLAPGACSARVAQSLVGMSLLKPQIP